MLGGCLLLGTRMSWLVRHVSWGNGLIQHSARDQTRGNNYQLLLGNTSSQLVSHNHDVTETLAARLHMHHIMNRTVVNFPNTTKSETAEMPNLCAARPELLRL